jgi:hypothetical protein
MKKKKKILLILTLLGLFIAKKHDLCEKKKFPYVTHRCRWTKNLFHTYPTASSLKARKLKYRLPESFGPNWCPAYSEFWNLESLGYLSYKFQRSDRRTVQKFDCASQKNKKDKKLVSVSRLAICEKFIHSLLRIRLLLGTYGVWGKYW